MEWGDVLRAAAAFFLVLTALSLTWALVRLATTLARLTRVLEAVERDGVPLLGQVATTLHRVDDQLGKLDVILGTAAHGVESADRTARTVARVVEAPVVSLAAAGAFVRGAAASLRARRSARRGTGTPS